jgi:hypothetical protein
VKRKSKYRRRPRDLKYMEWVRQQPCAARELTEGLAHDCYGPVEADHAGLRPVGQKADDRTCIPLCTFHHEKRASFHGLFRSWNQEKMRAWLLRMIERYQALYAQENP